MKKQLYPLTNPQKSIYLTEEYYKGTNINNVGGPITIFQSVDFDKLILAIKQTIKQNDGCRIMFSENNEKVNQWISDYKDFPIEIIDVSSETELDALTKKVISSPLFLYDSYLFKFVIFRFPDNHGGFIINMHHLISDSWTLGIVINEIIDIYYKYLKNENFTSKDTTLYSYTNYIASELKYKNSSKYEKDKCYWEEVFSTIPNNATIPSTNSYAVLDNSINALREEFHIPAKLLNNIKEYCNKKKVSLFNFFTAIFSVYISKVCNLEDFCIGTPILNRSNYKEKNTTGMFINTLPIRINIKNSLTFEEFLNSLMKNSMSLLRHQKYSYQNILEDLRKKQSNLSGLYNIMISYQITKMNSSQDAIPHKTSWYFNNTLGDDIDIHIFDLNDTNELNIAYDYKTNKYSSQDMKNIHNRILWIVSQVLNNENIIISNLEIVTPEEKEQLINIFNNTNSNYPKDKTISELFEEQVNLTPNNIALVFENNSLTYKELNEKANSLAYLLTQKQIKNNSIVGIMVNRSLEMIIGILAILKAGGAYIPIDPDYPSDRIEYILKNSNCSIVLTNQYLSDAININCEKIDISLTNKKIYNLSKDNLTQTSKPNDLSYLIYTSGSTGKPKGVMLTQKALVNLTYYCNKVIPYLKNREYISIVSVTSISFDIFIFETLISLQRGLKLVIANSNEQTIPNCLNSLIQKENIQAIQTTPSRMQLFYQHINDIPNLCNLKYITLAGEPLSIVLKNNLLKLTHGKIFNGYGPSETTVFSTLTDVTNKSNITIGKPISNTQIYILDTNLEPCPIGVTGEIYIAGDGVGLGYMQNSDLTQKSFIANPFKTNSIMYKTGDLGTYTENGEIICLGRADYQIKIRGLRIELGEIENVMSEYPHIHNCVVVKKVSNENHEFLCAYYTSDKTISENELRVILKSKLPNYMIPQYFIKLDNFPYTPNGKIDKKALPEIDFGKFNSTKKLIKPRNEIDDTLISILSEILKVKEISIMDSFYDLGGDSLSAIQLCSMVYHKLNLQISTKDVLSFPVIMDLSNLISRKIIKHSLSYIKPTKTKESYPASSAQKRIYYASQLEENSTFYNIALGILLEKTPDIAKLENCIQTLIKRHSSLRTYFALINNDLVQKITNNFDFNLEVSNELWKEKDKLINNYVKPFDLHKPLLFRAKLILFENKKSMLLIDTHHSILDGTSLSIFLKELSTLYNDGTLEDKIIDYKDFSSWENDYFKSKSYKEDKKYWLDQFSSEIPVLHMPSTLPRPSKQSFEGDSFRFSLGNHLSEELLNISKKENITPYMLFLSAYFILLYKYTGEENIVVGTPIMNRENLNLKNILGTFINNLALKTKINSNEKITTFLQMIKNLCLNSFSHQRYPFNHLVYDLNLKRDISRNPIFDTMFIYQNNGYEPINLGEISTTYCVPNLKISKFDISLEIIPSSNNFEMHFEYSTNLFTKDYIEKMSTHYKNILNYIAHNLNSSIAKINILSHEEENKILYDFNNTYLPYNKNVPLMNLFEEQTLQNPEKTAIIFEDLPITYYDLNKKANQLAHCLIEKYHIHKNNVVGILLKRSIETIVSMLAVLKTGATYLLIDESLPHDRIIYMLENSSSSLLITNHNVKNIDFSNKLIISKFEYDKYSQNTPKIDSSNDDGFCIVYTSGSTGTPKGVLLKRIGVYNLVLNHQKVMNTDQCNNFLSISAVSFDMFIVETFVTLLSGKTLILSNEEQQKIPLYTCELITKYNVDFILTTPSRMNLLIENSKNNDILKNFKIIQLGGEIFTQEMYEKLKSMTNANIYNGYGPSESTACCSCKKVTSGNITIGTPFYNTKLYLCNKDLNLVPIGFAGEICISGDGVARGYVNNEELTKKSFVKNPFNDDILYRTGDLAYYTEDGELIYIGRKDFQIKIRGLRIELSEIEKQMLKISNITNVSVIYNNESQYIAAFFTSSNKQDISTIRNELSKTLPLYMVPKYFKQLKELPITPNGKVNKKQLQNYNFDVQENNINYVAPQSEKQKLFCSIWSKLLNHQIGIEDNVFEYGADSLSAIKFKIELLSYNINIPYSNIFNCPTVKELSENCMQTIKEEKKYDYSTINQILEKNSIQNIHLSDIKKNNNNNILLLGSTGFVGIHILYSFIKNDKGIVYCIVRNKKDKSGYDRLINILHFYFGTELDSYINNRIIILNGNVLEENFGLPLYNFNNVINNISTIINAAAIVKHYGNKENFEKVNVDLSKKITTICEKYHKRFLHISSTSVSGNSNSDIEFSEKNLYIGQNLDNIYINSKFNAEKLILEKIAQGLNATILRLGNMTSRFSDGVFQFNANSNAFVNKLKTFANMKVIPKSLMKLPLEFTPVDLCANAIITILQNYIPNISVLHLYNDQLISMESLIDAFAQNGIDITCIPDSQFETAIQSTLKNENKDILSGIVVDMNENTHLNYNKYTNLNSEFSKFFLHLVRI